MKYMSERAQETAKVEYEKRLIDYSKHPNLCKNCNTRLEYSKRKNKFCSSSCSATVTNQKRVRAIKPKKQKQKKNSNIWGEYSPAYLNICKISGKRFYAPRYRKYHEDSLPTKERYYRECKFNFSFSEFPDFFCNDIELLRKHGMYSTPGKCKNGKYNIQGVSRDHIVSISYGFNNKIDARLLCHPANCRLLLHSDNSKKNKECALTIDELQKRIAHFDQLYPLSRFRLYP